MQNTDLGWALGVTFRAYLRAGEEIFAELPGGPRGHQVLAAAVQGPERHQLALAQHLGIDRTVMTYLLDDLVAAGLVERQADPADRRARRVVATPAGRTTLDALQRRLMLAEGHLLSALSDDDRETFRALLHEVADHVHRLDPVSDACEVVEEIRNGAPQNSRSEGSSRPRKAS